MTRTLVLVLALLAVGCANQARPAAHAGPMDGYSQAVDEAVERYEIEVWTATGNDRSLPANRYAALLESSLRARGLTRHGLEALAHEDPQFYFTLQAIHAQRLERLQSVQASRARVAFGGL